MFNNLRRTLRVLRILRRFSEDTLNSIQRFDESIDILGDEMDALRSKLDVRDELLEAFITDRKSADYQHVYEKKSPLVSVCIGTYNRGRLLAERSVQSVLAQDYSNLEIIVVGDCCTDDTDKRMAAILDTRLRFVNLPERGRYPENPHLRWMVAGTTTFNHALNLAQGDFITHLDDDDEYAPDRIGKLVRFIRQTRAELVWHPFWAEYSDGSWHKTGTGGFTRDQVTTSSVLYHRWFKRIPWDMNAYKYLEPGDWNRFRKFKYLNPKVLYLDDTLLKHFRERNQNASK
jgi:glycosyltransferase involved in cell wall biosynthesis